MGCTPGWWNCAEYVCLILPQMLVNLKGCGLSTEDLCGGTVLTERLAMLVWNADVTGSVYAGISSSICDKHDTSR